MSGNELRDHACRHDENYESMILSECTSPAEVYEQVVNTVPDKPQECYEDLIPDSPNREKSERDRKFRSLPTGLSSKMTFSREHEMLDKAKKHLGKDGLGGKVVKQMTKLKYNVEKKFGSSEKAQNEKPSFHSKVVPKFFRRKSEGHVAHNEYRNNSLHANAPKGPKVKGHHDKVQPNLNFTTEDRLPDDEKEKTVKEASTALRDCQQTSTAPIDGHQTSITPDFSIPTDNETDSDDGYLKPDNKIGPPGQLCQYSARSQEKGMDGNTAEENCSNHPPEHTNIPLPSDDDNDEVYEILCYKSEKVTENVSENDEKIHELTGRDSNNPKYSNTSDKMLVPSSGEKLGSRSHHGIDVTSLKLEGVKTVLLDLGLEKYVDKFEKERIDGLILSKLSAEDFSEELGMRKLEIVRLCEFVKSGHVPK